jgi:hypothetical protein
VMVGWCEVCGECVVHIEGMCVDCSIMYSDTITLTNERI